MPDPLGRTILGAAPLATMGALCQRTPPARECLPDAASEAETDDVVARPAATSARGR